MPDTNQKVLDALFESNKALIISNESISESVRANSETVKELTVSVRELVSTERERVIKDQFQKEVNAKQDAYNLANEKKWTDAHDVIVRSKLFFVKFDKVSIGVMGVLVMGVLALLGFSFK